MGDYLSVHKTGPNNPMYKDGTSDNGRGENWYQQRRAAFKRDGGKCQRCGKQQKRGMKAIVDVHHIVPYRLFNGDYKAANQLTNLIVLCKKCHALVEHHGYPCPLPLF